MAIVETGIPLKPSFFRDKRGANDMATMAKASNKTVDPIAARSSFVDEVQCSLWIFQLHLFNEFFNRLFIR